MYITKYVRNYDNIMLYSDVLWQDYTTVLQNTVCNMVYNIITHRHLSFSPPQQALLSASLNRNYEYSMLYKNIIYHCCRTVLQTTVI